MWQDASQELNVGYADICDISILLPARGDSDNTLCKSGQLQTLLPMSEMVTYARSALQAKALPVLPSPVVEGSMLELAVARGH